MLPTMELLFDSSKRNIFFFELQRKILYRCFKTLDKRKDRCTNALSVSPEVEYKIPLYDDL